MSEKTFNTLYRVLLFAMLVPLLHAFWEWGTPWFMGSAVDHVMPAIHEVCKETPGCVRMRHGVSWHKEKKHYVAHYEIVARKNMPKETLKTLANAIYDKAQAHSSLLYMSRMSKPYISVVYE